LMKRSAPHPRSKKTPRGGRMTAMMILQMSLAVKAIVMDWCSKVLEIGVEYFLLVEVFKRIACVKFGCFGFFVVVCLSGLT